MESRRNGPQLSSRHDDDDEQFFSRPYCVVWLRLWYGVVSICLSSVVCRLSSVCNVCIVAKRRGSAMVPLDRALVSSYRLSIVTMSLTAAVWPQFATQSFRQRYVHRNSLLLIYFTDTESSTIATNIDWPKSVLNYCTELDVVFGVN